jgi:hypothetical protein
MRHTTKLILSLIFTSLVSFSVFAEGLCPAGTEPVETQTGPDSIPRPVEIRYERGELSNYKYQLCYGVVNYRDTIGCVQFRDRPCISKKAASVCDHERNSSAPWDKAKCRIGAANKVYSDEQIDYCDNFHLYNLFVSRVECMFDSGASTDGE